MSGNFLTVAAFLIFF